MALNDMPNTSPRVPNAATLSRRWFVLAHLIGRFVRMLPALVGWATRTFSGAPLHAVRVGEMTRKGSLRRRTSLSLGWTISRAKVGGAVDQPQDTMYIDKTSDVSSRRATGQLCSATQVMMNTQDRQFVALRRTKTQPSLINCGGVRHKPRARFHAASTLGT